MGTPSSSVRLRRSVDAVATTRHETAFRVLDLLLLEPVPGGERARARLRRELASLRAALDGDDARPEL